MKGPKFINRSGGSKAGKVKLTALRKRRDELANRFGEMQYDLGGLVYEMSMTKTYNAEIVDGRSIELSRIDAELAEAERLLRLEDAGAAGSCPSCGALHARGAAFCWKCGGGLSDVPLVDGASKPEVPPVGGEVSRPPAGAPLSPSDGAPPAPPN